MQRTHTKDTEKNKNDKKRKDILTRRTLRKTKIEIREKRILPQRAQRTQRE